MGTAQHKHHSPESVKVALLTVSTTRSIDEDESGRWMAKRAAREGHKVVAHKVVKDRIEDIRVGLHAIINSSGAQAVIVSGGTGISALDVTIEAIEPLFAKHLTAFGAIFAQLSYDQIDAAALLSRASAGTVGSTVVFCIPGSLKACKLACKALIFPELGHVVGHLLNG